jgi:hypothetical protein
MKTGFPQKKTGFSFTRNIVEYRNHMTEIFSSDISFANPSGTIFRLLYIMAGLIFIVYPEIMNKSY